MRLIPKGTLLFSFKLTIGKMAFAGTDLYTNEAIAALFPKDSSLDTKFLQFSLKFIDPSSGSSHAVKGKTLNRNGLREIRIPLPPLPEQKRIAATLTEKLAAVEQARKASETRLEAARALPAAYLREVLEAKGKTLPDGWRWVALGDVCTVNPRRPVIERDDSELTAFVPMEAIDAVTGSMDSSNKRPYIDVKKGYTYFEEGDVVFSKITPCMQNGKHAIACNLIDGMAFGTTEFHVVRPTSDIIADWIHLYLRQPEVLHDAEQHFTGAVGQRRVPSSFLEELEIPLPPLHEQKQIAADLTGKFANVEQIKDTATEQSSAIESLPASLLRQAFSGAL